MISQIRDYRIIEKIGEGGMGSVFLGEDLQLDRKVAIKALNPLLCADPALIQRFRQEAKIQASLLHPNIVTLYNFFQEAESYYIIMEYVPGETLKQYINKNGSLKENEALEIFAQMLAGVGYAHKRGLVHRDIKPGNFLIDSQKNVKVLDFGISKILGDKSLTATGIKLGTIHYMSPEQVRAEKDIDERTDIYSMGISLLEMLSGTLPFDSNTDSEYGIMSDIINGNIEVDILQSKNVSAKTIETVRRAIKTDKHERFSSTDEFMTALRIKHSFREHNSYTGASGSIQLTCPPETKLFLDGKELTVKGPCRLTNIPFGNHILEFSNPGYKIAQVSFSLDAESPEAAIKPDYLQLGSFIFRTLYSDNITFKINNHSLQNNSELYLIPGEYLITSNASFIEDVAVKIEPGRKTEIDLDKFISKIETKIEIGDEECNVDIVCTDRKNDTQSLHGVKTVSISLLPGHYKIKVFNKEYNINSDNFLVSNHSDHIDLSSEIYASLRNKKRKKYAIIGGVIITAFILFLLFLLPPILEYSAWESIKAQNTEAAYSEYISKYPKGKYLSEAMSLKELAAWEEAKRTDTETSYINFLTAYPESKYESSANKLMEPRMWERVKAGNSWDLINSYIEKYPGGIFVLEAKKLMDPLLWEYALKEDSENAYNKYISLLPEGENIKEAKMRLETVIWKNVLSDMDISGFKAYLENYPKGIYSRKAEELISVLEEESGNIDINKDIISRYGQYITSKDFNNAAALYLPERENEVRDLLNRNFSKIDVYDISNVKFQSREGETMKLKGEIFMKWNNGEEENYTGIYIMEFYEGSWWIKKTYIEKKAGNL